jgi:hypothetical protein
MLPTSSGGGGSSSSPKRKKRKKMKKSDGAPNQAVVDGAKAVWTRMRDLKAANVASAVPAQSEEEKALAIAHASELLVSPELREAQIQRLTEHYQDFVESVKPKTDEWRAVYKYVKEGQSHFNDYLEWTDERNRYGNDVTRYFEDEKEDSSDDDEGRDDYGGIYYAEGDWWVMGRPERQVLALYGLVQRAPTLGAPTVLLHSVKSYNEMPGGDKPTPGQAHLITQFVSASVAPLNDFLAAQPDPPLLSSFYRQNTFEMHKGCCMCAITVDANVSVVPIFMDNRDSDVEGWSDMTNWHYFYKKEMEVLLPPGLVYVFQGARKIKVIDEKATQIVGREIKHHFKIYFYRAMLPPDV